MAKQKTTTQIANEELSPNEQLNQLIRKLMGKRTASKIAEECNVSVSTITRIRNGENKRGIHEDLLFKIYNSCKDNANISFEELMAANQAVLEVDRKTMDDRYRQDEIEIDHYMSCIPNNLIDSGAFIRKLNSNCNVIPGFELFYDMVYEVSLDSGEKKKVLFDTHFYSKRSIEAKEKRKENHPDATFGSPIFYRKILEFQELRVAKKEHKNSELVFVFNYVDQFNANAKYLKNLSNTKNVVLLLLDSDTGKFTEAVTLDGSKSFIAPLLVKKKKK